MEQEFVVKFVSEGTFDMSPDIDKILGVMGCDGFNNRYLGSVKAVAEKVDGKIVKQKLVWGEDNDPKFNETHMRNATVLLGALVNAVDVHREPSDGTIKYVIKR